jgi:hypothetical protein
LTYLYKFFKNSAYRLYSKCDKIAEFLKKSESNKNNDTLLSFLDSAQSHFSRKKKIMNILYNLNNELNKENIILKKNANEQLSFSKTEKFKEKVIEKKDKKNEYKLSIIQEQDSEIANLEEKNNNIEISEVGQRKLEQKEKNVSEIINLINKCEEDIVKIEQLIKKYKNIQDNLIMESRVIGDKSMVFIERNEESDNMKIVDSEEKRKFYERLKSEYISLKKKLEDLLSLFKIEKELTEIKKNELENFEKLKSNYDKLKQKKI